LFEFAGTDEGLIRQNLDVSAFKLEKKLPLRLLTVIQEEGPAAVSDGLLRQWAQPSLGVEKHHGYAFQWFALSALTAGLWLWFQVLQPRRRASQQALAKPPCPSH
jgi:surfeit locus 1 family protein